LKTSTEKQVAIGQLIIAAFFFACRLCEYLKVPNQDQQLTKQLTLGNIVFYKAGKIIPHKCSSIFLAECVSITFETQKNKRKFDTVTQYATLHPVLCPVKQWAEIVKRISLYPGASKATPVSAVLRHKRIAQITQKMVNEALRDGVKALANQNFEYWHRKSEHIRCVQEQQWQCILEDSQFMPSNSLADGQATPS
jgi:hypothetical protein